MEPAAGGDLAEDGEGGVGGDGHLGDHAVPSAVLGDVGDAEADGPGGGVEADGLAAQEDLPLGGGGEAEQDAGELGASGADEPGESEDLPGPDGEADAADAGGAAPEVARLEHDVA